MNEGTLSQRTRSWLGALLSMPRRPIVQPRLLRSRPAPYIALALIIGFSCAARLYGINQPCFAPCSTPVSELILDESYYVNAARSIAGVPQGLGSPYLRATSRAGQITLLSPPSGDDPNPGHPQLAKVVIAGGIGLLGDGPWGWRLGSVLFSLIAMGAMYALVTGAGGTPWLAVGAVAVMALDNLLLVQGRIAMLDIYALAMMLVAGAFYVRRHPLLAGAALGVGSCMKEVALYLLVALVLFEAMRLASNRWGGAASRAIDERPAVAIRALAGCVLFTFVTFFALLWVLDLLVPAWAGPHTIYAGNPFAHFAHIVKGAASLTTSTPHSPLPGAVLHTPHPRSQVASPSLSSTPLQWLINQRPIEYAEKVVPILGGHTSPGGGIRTEIDVNFRGEMNPFIIFLALPALGLALVQGWRTRDRVAWIGAAWGVGVFLPFLIQSAVLHRVSYLYYMLIALPGVYLMTARLASWRYVPRLATIVWAGLLVFGFVHLYPIRTLP